MNHKSSGNVLFLILIAVALFAALAYAVTSTSNSGVKNSQKEKDQTYIAQLLQYATSLQTGVQRLKLINGCDDTQLGFGNTVWQFTWSSAIVPLNHNPSAIAKCKLFDPAGGNLRAINIVPEKSPYTNIKKPGNFAVSVAKINGVGTDEPDLVLTTSYFTDEICQSINEISGNGSILPILPVSWTAGTDPFNGTFPSTAATWNFPSGMAGAQTGCTKWCNAASCVGNVMFFHVLVAR